MRQQTKHVISKTREDARYRFMHQHLLYLRALSAQPDSPKVTKFFNVLLDLACQNDVEISDRYLAKSSEAYTRYIQQLIANMLNSKHDATYFAEQAIQYAQKLDQQDQHSLRTIVKRHGIGGLTYRQKLANGTLEHNAMLDANAIHGLLERSGLPKNVGHMQIRRNGTSSLTSGQQQTLNDYRQHGADYVIVCKSQSNVHWYVNVYQWNNAAKQYQPLFTKHNKPQDKDWAVGRNTCGISAAIAGLQAIEQQTKGAYKSPFTCDPAGRTNRRQRAKADTLVKQAHAILRRPLATTMTSAKKQQEAVKENRVIAAKNTTVNQIKATEQKQQQVPADDNQIDIEALAADLQEMWMQKEIEGLAEDLIKRMEAQQVAEQQKSSVSLAQQRRIDSGFGPVTKQRPVSVKLATRTRNASNAQLQLNNRKYHTIYNELQQLEVNVLCKLLVDTSTQLTAQQVALKSVNEVRHLIAFDAAQNQETQNVVTAVMDSLATAKQQRPISPNSFRSLVSSANVYAQLLSSKAAVRSCAKDVRTDTMTHARVAQAV